MDWPEAKISTTLSRITENRWNLKLNSGVLVKDVQIRTAETAKLSDNFFDLMPNEELEIRMDFKKGIAETEPDFELISVRKPTKS